MRRKTQLAVVTVGLLGGLGVSSAFAQSADDKTMSDDKMAGDKMPAKMSHKQMMDKMNAMSAADKAAMFDKMSEQDKADMFDKMPMEKRMAMMKADSAMKSKMMGHDTMDKH
jgi:hypothetical protein